MSFVVTDSSAKNIYRTMYDYYQGANMPDDSTGVFFGFANYTKDKLIYTIEFLRRQYSLGWFTDDYNQRKEAFDRIANALYIAFDQTVSKSGIVKFCNWVYSWAKKDQDAAAYFSGSSDWSLFDSVWRSVTDTVGEKVSNAVETIDYGLKVPSLDVVTPSKNQLIKWALIIGGGLLVVNYVSKKFF